MSNPRISSAINPCETNNNNGWQCLLILFCKIVHNSLLLSQIRITFIRNLNFCHFYLLMLVLYPKAVSSLTWYCFKWLEKVIVLPLILTKIQCFSSFYYYLYNCFFKCDTNIIAFQLQALELVYVSWSTVCFFYLLSV